jgi:hypothetical protein
VVYKIKSGERTLAQAADASRRHSSEVRALHQYRLTKYDPALRDERGAFTGDDWTAITDIGDTFAGVRLTLPTYLEVEGKHLASLASFIDESSTEKLVADGVENAEGGFRVHDGDELTPIEAVEAVRQMLRDEGWCRLVDGDRFYIHVGWDYYFYVGSDAPCEKSVEFAQERGAVHRPRLSVAVSQQRLERLVSSGDIPGRWRR